MFKLNGTITQAELKRALDYNPETGEFRWRWRSDVPNNVNFRLAGKEAGSINDEGYRNIEINGRAYKASRLAWLYVNGAWPSRIIDHKNLNRSDDRFDNFRLATKSENGANSPIRSHNRSGFKGVVWQKDVNKWRAECRKDGKLIYLGLFSCIAAASIAYQLAALEHHGEFARHA